MFFLNPLKIFSNEDLEFVRQLGKFRRAIEGEILNRGESEGKVFFVNKDSIRAFYTKNEEEITRMIAWENRLINIGEMNNYSGYKEVIECLEEVELIYFTKEDFDILVEQSPAFRDFAFQLLEMHLLRYVEKSHYMGMVPRVKCII